MTARRESSQGRTGAEGEAASLEAFLLDATATARVLDDEAARRAADKNRRAAADNPRLSDAIDALKEADTLPPPPSVRKKRPLRPPPESERREYQQGQVPSPTRRDTLELQQSVEVSPNVDPRRRPTQPRVTPPDPPRRSTPEDARAGGSIPPATESAAPATPSTPGPSAQSATRAVVLGALAAVAVAAFALRAAPPRATDLATASHVELSAWRVGGGRALELTRLVLTQPDEAPARTPEAATAAAPPAPTAQRHEPRPEAREARAAAKASGPERSPRETSGAPSAEPAPGASSDLLYQRKEP